MLCVFARNEAKPSERSLQLVQDLCGPIALAIENARLFKAVQQELAARRRAEGALRESEEKFRGVFNNAQVGMFRTRLDGSEVPDVNEKLLEVFGATREEMLGLPSVIPWADPQERQEALDRLKTQGQVTDFECRMLNKRGEVMMCLLSLRLYRGQGILEGSIRDITDLKGAEEALKESERKVSETLEFNRKILNTSSIAILTFRESGQCTFANEAAAKMGGTDVASILAQNFHQVESWKKSGMYEAALEALRTGAEQHLETHHTTTWGKDVWFNLQFCRFHCRRRKATAGVHARCH